MRSSRFERPLVAALVLTAVPALAWAQSKDYAGVGRPATAAEIETMKGAGPSGKDLPPGQGTAAQGEAVFATKCVMCHGPGGEGVVPSPGSFSLYRGARLGGGETVPLWPKPDVRRGVTTFAYYVALPTSIWNAIAVSMPMFRAGTLTPDEIYSLTAFVLYKNNIIKRDDVMNRETLPKVEMPNRGGFVPGNIEDIPKIEERGCYKLYGVCP